MTDLQPLARRNTIGIVGAIASVAIFALTIGLTYPLLAFVLEAQGYDETAIGVSAAMTPLGILLASPLLPRVTQRFGAWQVAVTCLAANAGLLLLLGATQDYFAYLPLRFLLGVADCGVFVISETWINQLAPRHLRGRIIGIYATALSAGFAAGPLILSGTGVEGSAPFAIAALLCGGAIAVVLAIRKVMPDVSEEAAASPWVFIRLAPALLLAVAVFSLWDGVLLSLFPLFGLAHDLSVSAITLAIAICVLGNTFLQIPIGWIADKTSKRGVMMACAALAAAGAALLPALIGLSPLFLGVLFFWGAAAGGLYTMAMAELGDRFSGADLVAGNAAFAVAFGLGALIGGPLTGATMTLTGPDSFAWTLTAIFAAMACYAFWRRRGQQSEPAP